MELYDILDTLAIGQTFDIVYGNTVLFYGERAEFDECILRAHGIDDFTVDEIAADNGTIDIMLVYHGALTV